MGAPEGISNYQWFRFNLYFVLEHFMGTEGFEKRFGKNRKNLYSQIDEQLKGSNRGEVLPMPEAPPNVTLEEFKKTHIDNFLPAVFRGAALDWPCSKKWDFQYFKNNYADKEIIIVDNEGIIDKKNPQKFENTTFGKFVDELLAGSNKYLKFARIMDDDTSLKDDFDINWLRKFQQPGSFGENFLMFMGNTETMTPIHCGFGHTLFVQITGRKKWIFWKPNERIFFDPRSKRRNFNFTDADAYNLNDPAFPLFKYAKRYELILEPGDALWFPSQLWHMVENVEGGISVAHKFVHLPGCFRDSAILTSLFFLRTNPTIFTDFFYLKFKKRDFMYTRPQTNQA